MQANIAVGLLECSSIALGMGACDAMVKAASVRLARAGVIARGKFAVLVDGPTGEVESALRAGVEAAADSLVHQFILRNVHQGVLDALDRWIPPGNLDDLGVIETREAVAAVQAADASAKAARVQLLEVRTSLGGGKGLVTLAGEPSAVRTAVAAGIGAVPKDMLLRHVIISRADAQLLGPLGGGGHG
jgi:microcompartment protein CcmL/EutN